MTHWRLWINRETGKATIELKNPNDTFKPWMLMGQVKSQEEAERLIREGWPDHEGTPTQSLTEPYTIEVVR